MGVDVKPYPGIIPRKVDLRPNVDAVRDRAYPILSSPSLLAKFLSYVGWKMKDQGNQGACTAFGSTTALEVIYERAGEPVELSPQYQYYWSQFDSGTLGQSGAYPAKMIATLKNRGVSTEAIWPTIDANIGVKPSAEADASAADHRIRAYEEPMATDLVAGLENYYKNCIANGSPVMFSWDVYQGYFDEALKCKDWRQTQWSNTGRKIGGHEVAFIGFDDDARRFLAQGSYGPDVADGGFFGFPYDKAATLLTSAYVITEAQVPLIPVAPAGYPTGETSYDEATDYFFKELFGRSPKQGGLNYHSAKSIAQLRQQIIQDASPADRQAMIDRGYGG